jgi:integrase
VNLTRQRATRHSYVSRKREDGHDKEEIMRAAGHRSSSTTERYNLNAPPKGFSDAIRGVKKP